MQEFTTCQAGSWELLELQTGTSDLVVDHAGWLDHTASSDGLVMVRHGVPAQNANGLCGELEWFSVGSRSKPTLPTSDSMCVVTASLPVVD